MGLSSEDESKRRKLVGCENFVRNNPHSDKFAIERFHHIEFYTADATSTCKRMQVGLGMALVAKSDTSTGSTACTSYVLRSNDLTFMITAPQGGPACGDASSSALPGYDPESAFAFIKAHGLAVRSIGLRVGDAAEAHRVSTANGAESILPPAMLRTAGGSGAAGEAVVSEVKAYGDVALRFVSGAFSGPFLPGFEAVDSVEHSYGLQRLDHCVGNAPALFDVTDYLMKITGMHEFAEFTSEDVGTVDSGLNSMVLANNSELVLLPVNEPTTGTKRKSQIQTYLDYNGGAGVQHLALKTDNIFATLRRMRALSDFGGLEFMPRASKQYYKELPERTQNALTAEQYREVEELGILADKDDQGILLQIFTKPLGDRPTLFFEVIQRIGCEEVRKVEVGAGRVEEVVEQAGGCGGFGKGNFRELFKSIEQYEDELHV